MYKSDFVLQALENGFTLRKKGKIIIATLGNTNIQFMPDEMLYDFPDKTETTGIRITYCGLKKNHDKWYVVKRKDFSFDLMERSSNGMLGE